MKKGIVCDSKLGAICIGESDGFLTDLFFGTEVPSSWVAEETPLLRSARAQLEEYFAGARRAFDLPLAPAGTAFQQSVWRALQGIPYGETRSYKDIAHIVGRPRGMQAVGQANGHNPISIVIPCHRVVGSDGSLTGYAGGLPVKKGLLELEGACCP